MDSMSIDLSQKILYTWQVAGVGAGYIGKKNTTWGCAFALVDLTAFVYILLNLQLDQGSSLIKELKSYAFHINSVPQPLQ